MQFLEQIPLAPLTTFGIGGPARWFAEAATEDDVVSAVEFARERALPVFVLGGGSNLLVADSGYAGLVLRIALKGIREIEGGGIVLFEVAAGEDWDALVTRTVERNCEGMECLAGIPGSVGGTPVQNVGAYGQEVAQTIARARCYDREQDRFVELSNHECGFAYRTSRFNTGDRNRFIVTSVSFELRTASPAMISYADLKQHFKDFTSPPSLGDVASAVRSIRRDKGMLITPGDPDCRSAGSFFKNPVIPREVFYRIAAGAAASVPHYPAGEGQVKIPAAWLLDQAGFHKGYAKGRAGISSRHTLALINRGEASASEVLALRDEIIAGVLAKFEIQLEPEPVWLG
jgi:UDP-N-acetylmuramate dehydrogenase